MNLTARVEDYLEVIFEIEISGRLATVTELANRLGVTKATVTAILKRMKESDLLEHERYGDIVLTETGQKRASIIYRRHEFLTDFFVNVLGLSVQQARSISCVMEHEISERTEAKLAAFTDAILLAESENLLWYQELKAKVEAPSPFPIPLAMPGKWTCGTVCRLTSSGEMRRHLMALGFDTGVRVERRREALSANPFPVFMNGGDVLVSKDEASTIWINVVEEE